MADKEWTEEKVRVGDTELVTIKGGKGKPLLLLHGELGWPGWTPWNSALAKERTLIAPIHPGFGKTAMADWIIEHPRPGRLLSALRARAEAGTSRRDRPFARRMDRGRDGGGQSRLSSAR